MKVEKVDEFAIGINNPLARKYNALVNFIKDNTTYEDGCLCAKIESIKYDRRPHEKRVFETVDCIEMKVKVLSITQKHCILTENTTL
jgi:hypothetical protein